MEESENLSVLLSLQMRPKSPLDPRHPSQASAPTPTSNCLPEYMQSHFLLTPQTENNLSFNSYLHVPEKQYFLFPSYFFKMIPIAPFKLNKIHAGYPMYPKSNTLLVLLVCLNTDSCFLQPALCFHPWCHRYVQSITVASMHVMALTVPLLAYCSVLQCVLRATLWVPSQVRL